MVSLLPHLILGFQGVTPQDPGVLAMKEWINRGLGGVLLFGRNIENPHQVKTLTTYLSGNRDDVLIAIDQEGGMVERLPTKTPSARDMVKYGYKAGWALYGHMARHLKECGVNWNFAPCVDLHRSDSPAIGHYNRSFSPDPDVVTDWARIFMDAHHHYGVLTALKHWPGHGFAMGDTHGGLVDVTDSYDAAEGIPFSRLKTRADSIMIAHLVNKNWDPRGRPMTMSEPIIQNRLRRQGYNGILVSDDMWMGAIQGHVSSPAHAVCQSLQAGCDYVIVSRHGEANTGRGAWYDDGDRFLNDLAAATIDYPTLPGRLDESRHRQIQFLSRLKSIQGNGEGI